MGAGRDTGAMPVITDATPDPRIPQAPAEDDLRGVAAMLREAADRAVHAAASGSSRVVVYLAQQMCEAAQFLDAAARREIAVRAVRDEGYREGEEAGYSRGCAEGYADAASRCPVPLPRRPRRGQGQLRVVRDDGPGRETLPG